MPPPISVLFTGGNSGPWRVRTSVAVIGKGLPNARAVAIDEVAVTVAPERGAAWWLRGTTSNHRYAERAESDALAKVQPPLGRHEATRAALIPMRKTDAWWALAQDERRRIFETDSHHIALGLKYLPAIARRLHHGRELGEPFDFLAWFEFAPENEALFDEVLAAMRATEEWKYVEREVEIRLER